MVLSPFLENLQKEKPIRLSVNNENSIDDGWKSFRLNLSNNEINVSSMILELANKFRVYKLDANDFANIIKSQFAASRFERPFLLKTKNPNLVDRLFENSFYRYSRCVSGYRPGLNFIFQN